MKGTLKKEFIMATDNFRLQFLFIEGSFEKEWEMVREKNIFSKVDWNWKENLKWTSFAIRIKK